MEHFKVKKQEFKEFYASNQLKLLNAEKSFANLIHLLLSSSNEFSLPKVQSRIKKRDECINKFAKKYLDEVETVNYCIEEYITDLIGIRIICLYETDILKVVDIMKTHFEVVDITDKYKNEVEINTFGYKAIHLDLKLKDNRKKLPEYKEIANYQFEVQVRSTAQDVWSVFDHELRYKNKISHKLQRRIFNLAALFELVDREFDAIKEDAINEGIIL